MILWFRRLSVLAAGLALVAIILSAWLRLSAAGMGCQDWPACYGVDHWADPDWSGGGWPAGLLTFTSGLLMLLGLGLVVIARRNRQQGFQPQRIPILLLVLLLIQLVLTSRITLLFSRPAVMLLYLVLSMVVFCLWFWLALRSAEQRPATPPGEARRLVPWIITGLLLAGLQGLLGAWTSVNFAALACPELPTCQESWWPEANFYGGFAFWREFGTDPAADSAARLAIHLSHRLGALLVFMLLILLSVKMMRRRSMDIAGRLLMTMLPIQLILGLLQVALELPLPVVLAHSTGGALLLACLLYSLHRAMPHRDR